MIPALAFVNPANIIEAFETLSENQNFLPDAQPILNYFEDVYVGRRLRRGRLTPQFPPDLWNVHERTIDGQHRTNNDVEWKVIK